MVRNKQTTKDLGDIGEQAACDYLKKKGYAIVERNFRVKGGEIDIVARKQKQLFFIEVKFRSSLKFGLPEEFVSLAKLKRIDRAIRVYFAMHHMSMDATPFCVEIVAIEKGLDGNLSTRHIQNIVA